LGHRFSKHKTRYAKKFGGNGPMATPMSRADKTRGTAKGETPSSN